MTFKPALEEENQSDIEMFRRKAVDLTNMPLRKRLNTRWAHT